MKGHTTMRVVLAAIALIALNAAPASARDVMPTPPAEGLVAYTYGFDQLFGIDGKGWLPVCAPTDSQVCPGGVWITQGGKTAVHEASVVWGSPDLLEGGPTDVIAQTLVATQQGQRAVSLGPVVAGKLAPNPDEYNPHAYSLTKVEAYKPIASSSTFTGVVSSKDAAVLFACPNPACPIVTWESLGVNELPAQLRDDQAAPSTAAYYELDAGEGRRVWATSSLAGTGLSESFQAASESKPSQGKPSQSDPAKPTHEGSTPAVSGVHVPFGWIAVAGLASIGVLAWRARRSA